MTEAHCRSHAINSLSSSQQHNILNASSCPGPGLPIRLALPRTTADLGKPLKSTHPLHPPPTQDFHSIICFLFLESDTTVCRGKKRAPLNLLIPRHPPSLSQYKHTLIQIYTCYLQGHCSSYLTIIQQLPCALCD